MEWRNEVLGLNHRGTMAMFPAQNGDNSHFTRVYPHCTANMAAALYCICSICVQCLEKKISSAINEQPLPAETAPDRDGLIWVSVVYLSNDTSGRKQGG
jgi:hypothetical protein